MATENTIPTTGNPYRLALGPNTARTNRYNSNSRILLARLKLDGQLEYLDVVPDVGTATHEGNRLAWHPYPDDICVTGANYFLEATDKVDSDSQRPYAHIKKTEGGRYEGKLLAGDIIINLVTGERERMPAPPTDPLMEMLFRSGLTEYTPVISLADPEVSFFEKSRQYNDEFQCETFTDSRSAQGNGVYEQNDGTWSLTTWRDALGKRGAALYIVKSALDDAREMARIIPEIEDALAKYAENHAKPGWALAAEADLAETHDHFTREDARILFYGKIERLAEEGEICGRHPYNQIRQFIGELGILALAPDVDCKEPFAEVLSVLSREERLDMFHSLAQTQAPSSDYVRNNTPHGSAFLLLGDNGAADGEEGLAINAIINYGCLETGDQGLWLASGRKMDTFKDIRFQRRSCT